MHKDEEQNGVGLRLRSTQTEAVAQTPLSLEFTSNIAKLAAFQQKLFGASFKASRSRFAEPTILEEGEGNVLEVAELANDSESDEERASTGWTDDSGDSEEDGNAEYALPVGFF